MVSGSHVNQISHGQEHKEIASLAVTTEARLAMAGSSGSFSAAGGFAGEELVGLGPRTLDEVAGNMAGEEVDLYEQRVYNFGQY